MYLVRAQLFGIAPFGDLSFPFSDPTGKPRLVTVLHGGGGVGKTVLLHVLSYTRPGYASVLQRVTPDPETRGPTFAICDWHLGDDDPQRPHPLAVMTPNARAGERDERGLLRRREQSLFDQRARHGGFVFLALSAARWFSRQPLSIVSPLRSVASFDVRSTTNFDDATRCDLTREVKQALSYAEISGALQSTRKEPFDESDRDPRLLQVAMRSTVDALARLAGFHYLGVHPISLEPVFRGRSGDSIPFDELPTRTRHLVAFAALPVRALWAAYPGQDPRVCEGVVAIDELDLHQDPAVLEQLVPALRTALPRVQWICTTTSPVVASACHHREVLALRKLPERRRIALFVDEQARTH